MKIGCGALALALSMEAAAALAQTTGAAFLEMTNSPRAYALGMSNTVCALGAQAVGANPANMGLMPERFEATSSFATVMAATHLEHVAAAFSPSSFGPLDGLGLSVTRVQTPSIAGADASGNPTGSSFSSGDMAIGLSASARLTSGLRLGVTGKIVQETIAGYRSGNALAGDAGATWTTAALGKPLTVGASVTNLGRGVRFLSQVDPLPTALNAGVALPVGGLVAVAEVNRSIHDQRTEFGTGLEYSIGAVAFRAGYLAQQQAGNLALRDQTGAARFLNGMEGGLGLRFGPARLDYAVSQQAVELGATQRIALTIQWGSRRREGLSSDERANEWIKADRSDWLLRSMGGY